MSIDNPTFAINTGTAESPHWQAGVLEPARGVPRDPGIDAAELAEFLEPADTAPYTAAEEDQATGLADGLAGRAKRSYGPLDDRRRSWQYLLGYRRGGQLKAAGDAGERAGFDGAERSVPADLRADTGLAAQWLTWYDDGRRQRVDDEAELAERDRARQAERDLARQAERFAYYDELWAAEERGYQRALKEFGIQ